MYPFWLGTFHFWYMFYRHFDGYTPYLQGSSSTTPGEELDLVPRRCPGISPTPTCPTSAPGRRWTPGSGLRALGPLGVLAQAPWLVDLLEKIFMAGGRLEIKDVKGILNGILMIGRYVWTVWTSWNFCWVCLTVLDKRDEKNLWSTLCRINYNFVVNHPGLDKQNDTDGGGRFWRLGLVVSNRRNSHLLSSTNFWCWS